MEKQQFLRRPMLSNALSDSADTNKDSNDSNHEFKKLTVTMKGPRHKTN